MMYSLRLRGNWFLGLSEIPWCMKVFLKVGDMFQQIRTMFSDQKNACRCFERGKRASLTTVLPRLVTYFTLVHFWGSSLFQNLLASLIYF